MKKTVLILLFLSLLLSLCGCWDATMEFGIDADSNAYMKYAFEVDYTDLPNAATVSSAKAAVRQIVDKYGRAGFAVEDLSGDADHPRYTMTLTRPAGSYEEAFALLREMLCDSSITPFLYVDMSVQTEAYEQGFSFRGETDLSRILKTGQIDLLSPDIQAQLHTALDNSSGLLSLTLPATTIAEVTTVAESAGSFTQSDGFAIVRVPLSFTAPTELALRTRLSLENGALTDTPVVVSIAALESSVMRLWILLGVTALLFITMAALAVRFIIKNKRARAVISEAPDMPESRLP